MILISLDTTRRDHLSCYGYDRDTTPFLADLAERSVLFENAFNPATWTLPAHVSMLSGLAPHEHGQGLSRGSRPRASRAAS